MTNTLNRHRINNNKHSDNWWNGYPNTPEQSGWHWIDDADGLRPLFWRGDDWPDQIDQGSWEDSHAMLSTDDLSGWKYYGTAIIPDDAKSSFYSRLRWGSR